MIAFSHAGVVSRARALLCVLGISLCMLAATCCACHDRKGRPALASLRNSVSAAYRPVDVLSELIKPFREFGGTRNIILSPRETLVTLRTCPFRDVPIIVTA